MGCIIYEELTLKSNLTLLQKKQVILFAGTLIYVLTFDDVEAYGMLKDKGCNPNLGRLYFSVLLFL